jgi:hypothetical protein
MNFCTMDDIPALHLPNIRCKIFILTRYITFTINLMWKVKGIRLEAFINSRLFTNHYFPGVYNLKDPFRIGFNGTFINLVLP